MFLFSLYLIIIGTAESFGYICNHSLLTLTKTIIDQSFFDSNLKAQKNNKPAKLRISVVYGDNFDDLENSNMIKKDIIEPAVEYWHNTLTVVSPLSSPLLIDQFCDKETNTQMYEKKRVAVCSGSCFLNDLPSKIFSRCYQLNENGTLEIIGTDGEGLPNTDLGLVVMNNPNCEPERLAKATAFRLDSETDRPVMGLVVICNKKIDFSNIPHSTDVIKHELGHVLAFSIDLYAYFRDENGVPRTLRDAKGEPRLGYFKRIDNIDSIFIPDDSTFKLFNKSENTPVGHVRKILALLTTPKIVKEMKTHFNCPSLIGAPMEDTTGDVNGWSHFEKRIFFDTLMVPSITGRLYTTRFDLAVMEDSGWYIANYSRAINAEFGKGLGCDFVNKGCYEYLELKKSKALTAFPFCYESRKIECGKDKKSFYKCMLMEAPDSILPRYRYLNDKSLYFPDSTSDYCPMYSVRGFSSSVIKKWSYNCQNGNFTDKIVNYEMLKNIFQTGETSQCIESPKSGVWQKKKCVENQVLPIWGSGCYKYICSPTYGLLIEINKEKFQCLYDEENLKITTLTIDSIISGNITCPLYSDICKGVKGNTTVKLKKKVTKAFLNCPKAIMKGVTELSSSLFLVLSVTVIAFLNILLFPALYNIYF